MTRIGSLAISVRAVAASLFPGAGMGVLALGLVLTVGCAPRQPQSSEPKAMKEIKPGKPPPPAPRQIKEPIDPELRAQAKADLLEATHNSDHVIRANAIEGLQRTIGAEAKDQILNGLSDPDPLVRFAAAMAAGQVRLQEAAPKLVGMIDDPDPNVRVGVRFALHRLGDTRFSHDLEKYARDFNRSVRGNTAMALGLLGEKSALNVLRPMTTDTDPAVRLQVAEAMWRLGDDEGLQILVANTISQFGDDQIVAVLALAGPRDRRVSEHVRGKLTSDWTEVSLAAARSLGELGSDEGYTIAMNATKSVDPRQRSLAAFALGAIGRSDAQPALRGLLQDDDESVRIAAATAILRLKPPT